MAKDDYDYFGLTKKEYKQTVKTGILNYGKYFGGGRKFLRVSKFKGGYKMPSGQTTYTVGVKKRRRY